MSNISLKDKAVNGFKWSLIDNVANSGITFLVGLVLARLLSPVEFGILAIVIIFINLSNTIVDGGFTTALIRKNDATDDDYNTVFYSNIVLSLLLMLILIASSSWIANFFEQPILADVLPVMSVIVMINAVAIIQRTLLIKAIDFKTQAYISLIASLLSGIVGIWLAFAGYGVWSLVWQQLSRQTLLTILLWSVAKWQPSLRFSLSSFRDLFGFGSKLLIANIISSLYRNAFLVVIGKVYSASDLGQYNRADQFNNIFTLNLTQIIQKVNLPLLSKIQDDAERLQFSFRKAIIYSSLVSFFGVFALAAMAKPIVAILVGEQWLPSVYYLQIMCCYGAIYPIQNINVDMLSVMKRSDLYLRLEIIKKILFIGVILVGCFYALHYMLWAAVVYYYIEFFINSYYSHQLVGYGTRSQIRDLLPSFIICFIVALFVWSISLFNIEYWIMLLCQVVLYFVFHWLIYIIFRYQEEVELFNILKKYISY